MIFFSYIIFGYGPLPPPPLPRERENENVLWRLAKLRLVLVSSCSSVVHILAFSVTASILLRGYWICAKKIIGKSRHYVAVPFQVIENS